MDAINRHKMTLTLPSDVEFVLTRAFDAPRELVFRAWTEPKHLKQWFGCVSELVEMRRRSDRRRRLSATP